MNSLLGIWLYTSLIYQGHPIDRPDPSLQMYFIFNNANENELYYYHTSENGSCRRKASYVLENGKLMQKITFVEESNANFCNDDPDMQLGRESVSELQIDGDHLYLKLPLGDETITYVWTKQFNNGD
ncbi:MAG: hypothetical protein ACXWQQ_08920 [Pseudobdellovibrio sp.]